MYRDARMESLPHLRSQQALEASLDPSRGRTIAGILEDVDGAFSSSHLRILRARSVKGL